MKVKRRNFMKYLATIAISPFSFLLKKKQRTKGRQCSYCKTWGEIEHSVINRKGKILRDICPECCILIYDAVYEAIIKDFTLDDLIHHIRKLQRPSGCSVFQE